MYVYVCCMYVCDVMCVEVQTDKLTGFIPFHLVDRTAHDGELK